MTNGGEQISVNQQLQKSGLTSTATVGATATAISRKRPARLSFRNFLSCYLIVDISID